MNTLKKIIIILCPVFFMSNLYAQISYKKYLSNSIQWDLVYGGINGDEKNNLSELILKTNLPDSIKNTFFKLPNKQLITFLKDSATSWATNLLLYEKYREYPGHFLKSVRNKKNWESTGIKKIDIKYWPKKLSYVKSVHKSV